MFLLQQKRWKKHMMKEIKKHPECIDAQEMYFTDSEFSLLLWHEGRKEFVLHGEYYDVIQIKTVKGGKRRRTGGRWIGPRMLGGEGLRGMSRCLVRPARPMFIYAMESTE